MRVRPLLGYRSLPPPRNTRARSHPTCPAGRPRSELRDGKHRLRLTEPRSLCAPAYIRCPEPDDRAPPMDHPTRAPRSPARRRRHHDPSLDLRPTRPAECLPTCSSGREQSANALDLSQPASPMMSAMPEKSHHEDLRAERPACPPHWAPEPDSDQQPPSPPRHPPGSTRCTPPRRTSAHGPTHATQARNHYLAQAGQANSSAHSNNFHYEPPAGHSTHSVGMTQPTRSSVSLSGVGAPSPSHGIRPSL